MAFPIVRQHDALQTGMLQEADAEEVPRFALIPVGATPDAGQGVDLRRIAGEPALQPQTLLLLVAVQVVDNLKTRLGRISVHRCNRTQTVVLLVVLEEPADADD